MNDATNAHGQFRQRLDQVAADTESLLDRLLGSTTLDGERARPQRVMDAMRYASLGGGKRLRPFLVVETAALFKAPREQALMAGAALECVHCYSLAHDDLPAMDNDDLRRGRPTAHKKFDEATAILAGDGLLTFAFDILSRPETHPSAAARIELLHLAAVEAAFGGEIEHLPADHAAEPGRARERRDERDAHGCVRVRVFPRQDVEGEREQPVAREDRRRLIESLVRGRPPAPQIVIVHRRQVVVRERVTMHELERGAGHQCALARRLEQGCGLDHQERPQPFSAAEADMAHCVHQALRPRTLTG